MLDLSAAGDGQSKSNVPARLRNTELVVQTDPILN